MHFVWSILNEVHVRVYSKGFGFAQDKVTILEFFQTDDSGDLSFVILQ